MIQNIVSRTIIPVLFYRDNVLLRSLQDKKYIFYQQDFQSKSYLLN
jgi:hypothetical protein